MTLRLALLFLSFGALAFGQTPEVDGKANDQQPAAQTKPADDAQQPQAEAQRSTLQVQPGPPAIKPKDIWNETGIFHPFVRLPKYMLQDQKAIWTSPIHTVKRDVKYWAIFGAATAAFIATDRWTVQQLPNSSSQVSVSTWASRIGSAYTLIPITAGFYFVGSGTHEERFRETGLIGFETLIDTSLVVEAVKLASDRARPLESDGKGHFLDSPNGRWSSGFPSGHAISVWALASVVAHQYPHPRIVPILAYSLASTVVLARVGARQHFPGDVVAGSAMGWFIGDYVYGRRHNRDLDGKRSVAQRFLDQVHLGAEFR
ncbi:MAG TPA: phosphatase PAP2 family protein [Candidatus Acidoferrales bacterium]|nr:phosphatase PAP2 family protein [Candidatus Acidoferrales bacterium]